MRSRKTVSLPQSILISGCFAALLLPIGALGTKYRLWEFTTGFVILATGVVLSTICISLAVVTFVRHRKRGFYDQLGIYVGFTFSFSVLTFFVYQFYLAVSHPQVNDVTTDLLDPPRFEVTRLPDLFEDVSTSNKGLRDRTITGPRTVQTFSSRLSSLDAFDVALEVVNHRRWEIHLSDRDKGSIEFTDTTFWFGFKDDGVIRIRQDGQGSLVDLRSVSRVGKSDLGTNSRRIQRFLKDFSEASNQY